MRIALLEDDLDQAALFMEWLKSSGHTCEHFASGKQFIRKIQHDSYDVLILDWMVPDMDGYEVLRWVRENFAWPRLCEKSRAIVKLDIFSKTLRTFVVLSGIALTGPKCGTLCARTISRIASNLTR